MLETIKEYKLFGIGSANNKEVVIYNATINTGSVDNLEIASYISDYDLYKENKTELKANQISFEDMAYALQQSIISEMENYNA